MLSAKRALDNKERNVHCSAHVPGQGEQCRSRWLSRTTIESAFDLLSSWRISICSSDIADE